jgi:hypothetical protein
VDHPVAVGAQETQVPHSCSVAGLQRVHGLDVMAFYEAFATLAVPLLEVKSTGFARQFAELGEGVSLLGVNERRVAFLTAMHCRDNPALFGFLDLIAGRLRDGFTFLSAGEHLPNSFRHLVAPLGITRKRVP